MVLSTSKSSVSSIRIFGPFDSGPNAQMLRAASRSQSYLVWKNSPRRFLEEKQNCISQVGCNKKYGEYVSNKNFFLVCQKFKHLFFNTAPKPSGKCIKYSSRFPVDRNYSGLDIFRQAFLQGLSNHCQFILLIRRLGEALQRGRLHHRLAEGDDRVGHFDIYTHTSKTFQAKHP